jgi:hypothetical protein
MTSSQATSVGRQDRTLTTKAYLVGDKGPLKVDAFQRTAGQLVPEAADWSYKVRSIYLDQGRIQEIDLLSDHDRDLVLQP